jgi:hypothetical protein
MCTIRAASTATSPRTGSSPSPFSWTLVLQPVLLGYHSLPDGLLKRRLEKTTAEKNKGAAEKEQAIKEKEQLQNQLGAANTALEMAKANVCEAHHSIILQDVGFKQKRFLFYCLLVMQLIKPDLRIAAAAKINVNCARSPCSEQRFASCNRQNRRCLHSIWALPYGQGYTLVSGFLTKTWSSHYDQHHPGIVEMFKQRIICALFCVVE